MLVRELMNVLTAVDPDSDVFVALFTAEGTREVFDIDDVTEANGTVFIEINEEA